MLTNKLKDIYIKKFKILKDFKINFTDKKVDIPLPIVVIAGINGTGKTTLLEYIYKENENCFYFPADKNLVDIKSFMPKYIEKMVYEEDVKASEIYKRVRVNINEIFKNFNLNLEFDSRDGAGELYFRNKKGEKFLIDEISTGEKTLLSKVLYLYLKEIKDSVILIDEPELSLHPIWQSKILKLYENFAKKNNCQIIIATHSPHIIAHAPHKYLRFLIEENGEIISKELASTPLDRDINTIIKTIMGAEVIPQDLEKMHQKYRKLLKEKKLDTQEAKELKDKILEQESINSSFFQEIFFDTELLK